MILHLLSGYATAPSTTETALTMGSGDSLTILNAPIDSKIWLITAWGLWQTAGLLRITAPRMHDQVVGMVAKGVAGRSVPLFPISKNQPLFPQEILTVKLTGSGTAGDIEQASLLVFYDKFGSPSARLTRFDEIKDRIKNIVCVQSTLTMGTSGGYSGSKAINADFDPFKGNTDYALLGYQNDNALGAIGFKGPDTGNFRLGGPGDPLVKRYTSDWFVRLSKLTNLPTIPIINSANKAATFIDGTSDENATTAIIQMIFGEL